MKTLVLEDLKDKIGYIIYNYSDVEIFVKTSFNPGLAKIKPGYFYDLDVCRFVPKYLIDGVAMRLQEECPTHLKKQSDFWKLLLLEV